ncbi:putative inorganic phosphate cotransporter isoform X1 [Agrilus planipennis]|uniref:Inorganic phosphate cotransporter isoform X1 n=2 Tax=Agrilus planipennis TaxID=224129 RepID=A0A7F5RKY0_AGRPL|nr:putative inorganic phosphate cotransporter isoform X1 [Agrilus planipennis]
MAKIKQLEQENPDTEKQIHKRPERWLGVRHIQMTLLCLMMGIAYGQRVNLSVGIVAMTDKNTNPNENIPVYNWTNQNVILSAFFWVYFIPQIGAGQAAERFGAKWILVGTMLLSSVASILIPPLAAFGSWTVILCRGIQGFSQGSVFPCCTYLIGKWAPAPELSTIVAFVSIGPQVGIAASMSLTGVMSAGKYGWPLAFYTSGCLGLLWVVVYIILGSNAPHEHKDITPAEQHYIMSTLGNDNVDEPRSTPWKHMVLSLPVWAILVSNICSDWGLYTCLTEIPTYMNYVFGINIDDNGLVSALPYIANTILTLLFGVATDYIINKQWVSLTVGRKIANTIGFIVPGVAMLVLGLYQENTTSLLAIILLVLAGGVSAASTAGFMFNHLDLSPVYAGTIMGITNSIANALSIPSPLLVGVFVKDNTNAGQWSIVFYFTAGIYFLGGLFFLVFATGERQGWNYYDKQQKKGDKESAAEGHLCE